MRFRDREPVKSPDDARQAIAQMTAWVNNADVKAGLIATADTVLAGAVATQRAQVVRSAKTLDVVDVFALAALGTTVLGVLWCGFFLLRALMPRVRRGVFSRYSWTTLAEADPRSLTRTAPDAERAEAWAIAIALAQIVEAKYRAVRLALGGWVVGAVALLGWTALTLL
jgi:hypothetical protein